MSQTCFYRDPGNIYRSGVSQTKCQFFPVGEDGRLIREGRVAVWSSKYGKAKSFRIGGQLYVQFPVRKKPEKAEQPAQEGA